MKNFTLAIFGFLAAAANAVHLRQSSLMAEDDLELVETEQNFKYSPTHDCQFVPRRLKDMGYSSYANQVTALGSQLWTDSSFDASPEGIQWADSKTGSNADLSIYQNYPWQRLSDFCRKTNKTCTLFGDNGCTVDDIQQGSVGNCWFMATASALAEYPGLIENELFGGQIQNTAANGFYDVNLYHLGVPITIRVDDQIPMKYNIFDPSQITGPVFANVVSNGLWMPVLEKAMAKLFGNYSSLVSGDSKEATMALVGKPGIRTVISLTTTDQIVFNAVSAAQSEDLITAKTKATAYYGLDASHFYTILDVFSVKSTTGTAYSLIKLRNPHGNDSTATTHKFKDGDALWSSISTADKERMGYTLNNDGTFFMLLSEFRTAFDYFFVTPMLSNWTRSHFLILDDETNQPGKNAAGGVNYTRHEFTLKSSVAQKVKLMTNVHPSRIYPKTTGCGAGLPNVNGIRVVMEWNLPNSVMASAFYSGGEYLVNNFNDFAFAADTAYTFNVELFNNNALVARDFSLVAFGEQGEVTITENGGLLSDSFFTSGL